MNVGLYSKMTYDPRKDSTPIIRTVAVNRVMTVHPSVPARSQGVIDYAKANPGKLSYGSAGSGSAPHLATELLKQRAGIDMLHVPFKGGGPMVADLLGGQIHRDRRPGEPDAACESGQAARACRRHAGALGVLSRHPHDRRIRLPGFEARAWQGIAGPANLPADIVTQLNAAFAKAGFSGGPPEAARWRARSDYRHARRLRRVHPQRNRQVGQSGKGRRRARRLTASRGSRRCARASPSPATNCRRSGASASRADTTPSGPPLFYHRHVAKPPSCMRCNAWPNGRSGAMVRGSAGHHSAMRVLAGLRPSAITRKSASRSVKIPASLPSWMTSSAPTRCSRMRRAAANTLHVGVGGDGLLMLDDAHCTIHKRALLFFTFCVTTGVPDLVRRYARDRGEHLRALADRLLQRDVDVRCGAARAALPGGAGPASHARLRARKTGTTRIESTPASCERGDGIRERRLHQFEVSG